MTTHTPSTAPLTQSSDTNDADSTPVFASWWGWYGLVLGVFAALVGLFALFTQAFR